MRFLLVDDHPIVRRGMRELVTEEIRGSVVDEASTAEEALDLVEREVYDLVILGVSLPGRDGIEAVAEIHAKHPRVPSLVLSRHCEDQFAIRALRAGAAGYVTKDSAPAELLRAIQKALAGGKYLSAGMAERLAMHLSGDTPHEPHQALSDRELQVLRQLAAGRTVKEIASQLALSVKTVSTYRTRILLKMRLRNNAELIRYAVEAGLLE